MKWSPFPVLEIGLFALLGSVQAQNSLSICKWHTQKMLNEFCLQAGISHQVVIPKERGAQVRRKSFELQVDRLACCVAQHLNSQSLVCSSVEWGLRNCYLSGLPWHLNMVIHVESIPVSTWCVVSVYEHNSLPHFPHSCSTLTPVQTNMAAKERWLTAEISFRVCHHPLPNCHITQWLRFFLVLGTIKQARYCLSNAKCDFSRMILHGEDMWVERNFS